VKFQLFLERSNLGVMLLIVIFLILINTTSGEALWSKKIKEISNEELSKIKEELNITRDPRFTSYSNSDLKKILNKEMDPQKIKGLTYGVYILNAINEEKLVDLCSRASFYEKDASNFFSMLADNLANWQKGFVEKTTKLAIEAVTKACKMHDLHIGISSLFLAVDLAQIDINIRELNKGVYSRALWHYIASRKMGDSHEEAWDSTPLSVKYRNEQVEKYFESLWNKYRLYLSDSGLIYGFKKEQHEILKTSLLYALGAKPHLVITTPLKITPSPPYSVGDKINAEFTITNEGRVVITLKILTVRGRDPDGQVVDFTHRENITLKPGKFYKYKGTLTSTKAGKYHFFCAYQTPDGKWNPSIDIASWLTDEDRVEDINVQPPQEIKEEVEYPVGYPNRIIDTLSIEEWDHMGMNTRKFYTERGFGEWDIFPPLSIESLEKGPRKKQVTTPNGEYTYMFIKEGVSVPIEIGPGGTNIFKIEPPPTIFVIRNSDNIVVDKILMKGDPLDIAISADGKEVYVSYYDYFKQAGKIAVIGFSGTPVINTVVDTIPVDKELTDLAITPDGKYLYITNKEDNKISVIRTSDNTIIKRISVKSNPSGIVISPDGKYAYVAHEREYGKGLISVIRISDKKVVDTIIVDKFSSDLAITPDGKYLYLMHVLHSIPDNRIIFGYTSISVIQTSNNAVTGRISVGGIPVEIAITPDGKYAYVSVLDQGVSVIKIPENKLLHTIRGGGGKIAITPDGKYAYVIEDDYISVIRISDNTIVKIIDCRSAYDIAITPDGKYAYTTISLSGGSGVRVIRTSDNTIVDRIPLSYGIRQIIAASNGYVYVAGQETNEVFVIKSATATSS